MELRLSDPKKKDDDMGVILVDVCLMFRDATIKKGLVRQFLIQVLYADANFCFCCFTYSYNSFLHRNGCKGKIRYELLKLLHLPH